MHFDTLDLARRRALACAARGVLLAGLAATLAGCNTTASRDTTGSIPAAYRDRHPIAVKEGPRRAGDPPALVASADKIRRELGWAPARDFEGTLNDTIDWYLANRQEAERPPT